MNVTVFFSPRADVVHKNKERGAKRLSIFTQPKAVVMLRIGFFKTETLRDFFSTAKTKTPVTNRHRAWE
jgi:hypothetical protein